MEFNQVGCSVWKSEEENWLKDTTKLTLNSRMFLIEFFVLTVPSMLQYFKSLFYLYP